jgi:hypothetical protein
MGPLRHEAEGHYEGYVTAISGFVGETLDSIVSGQIRKLKDIEGEIEGKVEDYFKFKEERFFKGEERLEMYAKKIIDMVNETYNLAIEFNEDTSQKRVGTVTTITINDPKSPVSEIQYRIKSLWSDVSKALTVHTHLDRTYGDGDAITLVCRDPNKPEFDVKRFEEGDTKYGIDFLTLNKKVLAISDEEYTEALYTDAEFKRIKGIVEEEYKDQIRGLGVVSVDSKEALETVSRLLVIRGARNEEEAIEFRDISPKLDRRRIRKLIRDKYAVVDRINHQHMAYEVMQELWDKKLHEGDWEGHIPPELKPIEEERYFYKKGNKRIARFSAAKQILTGRKQERVLDLQIFRAEATGGHSAEEAAVGLVVPLLGYAADEKELHNTERADLERIVGRSGKIHPIKEGGRIKERSFYRGRFKRVIDEADEVYAEGKKENPNGYFVRKDDVLYYINQNNTKRQDEKRVRGIRRARRKKKTWERNEFLEEVGGILGTALENLATIRESYKQKDTPGKITGSHKTDFSARDLRFNTFTWNRYCSIKNVDVNLDRVGRISEDNDWNNGTERRVKDYIKNPKKVKGGKLYEMLHAKASGLLEIKVGTKRMVFNATGSLDDAGHEDYRERRDKSTKERLEAKLEVGVKEEVSARAEQRKRVRLGLKFVERFQKEVGKRYKKRVNYYIGRLEAEERKRIDSFSEFERSLEECRFYADILLEHSVRWQIEFPKDKRDLEIGRLAKVGKFDPKRSRDKRELVELGLILAVGNYINNHKIVRDSGVAVNIRKKKEIEKALEKYETTLGKLKDLVKGEDKEITKYAIEAYSKRVREIRESGDKIGIVDTLDELYDTLEQRAEKKSTYVRRLRRLLKENDDDGAVITESVAERVEKFEERYDKGHTELDRKESYLIRLEEEYMKRGGDLDQSGGRTRTDVFNKTFTARINPTGERLEQKIRTNVENSGILDSEAEIIYGVFLQEYTTELEQRLAA